MNYVKSFNLFGVDAVQIPCITGSGAPTTTTEAAVGCLYMDEDTGDMYKCISAVDSVYTWEKLVQNDEGGPELQGIRDGYDGYTHETAGEAVRSQVGDIEGRFEPSKNLINPDRLIMDTFCNGNSISSSTSYILTEFIPVKPSTPYWFSWTCSASLLANHSIQKLRFVSYYDSNKTYLSKESAEVRAFTTPENAAYVRLTLYKITITDIQVPMLFEGTTNATQIGNHPYVRELGLLDGEKIKERTVGIEKLSEEIITTGKNLFDKIDAPMGFLGFAPDEIQENASSVTSGYIPVKAGQSYTISPKARAYCLYDTHKDQVARATPEAQVTVTPEHDGFIRVTFAYGDLNTAQIEAGSEATAYEPFMRVLSPNIHLSEQHSTALYEYKNMLTGKKWYACGDSFTADGYGTSDQPKFEGGLYDGKNKVYPFYIGRRCGIDVTNLAVGGQTMAKVEGRGNCFSETIYQNVGADANYITIRLGINDDNQDVPIGTIDDTTNTTFYGAWNVVMEYLITNHPFAHIGIIVPNGANKEYVEAVKAIAVKWGVPYLDFATGEQVPLMHRTQRTNVTSVARTARHNAFIISASNTHPNADAHEYESYCIENWLMSL